MICDRFSFKGEVEGCERCSNLVQELCDIGKEVRLQGVVTEEVVQEKEKVEERKKRYEVRYDLIETIDVGKFQGLSKSEIIRRLLKCGLSNKEIVLVMQKMFLDTEGQLYNLVRYVKGMWKKSGWKEVGSRQRVIVRDDVIDRVNVDEFRGLSKSETAERLLTQGLHPKEIAMIMQKIFGGDVVSLYRTVKWVQYWKKKGGKKEEIVEKRRIDVREDVVNSVNVMELQGKTKTRIILELLERGLSNKEVAMVLQKLFPEDSFEKLYRLVRATKSVEKRKGEGRVQEVRKERKEKVDDGLRRLVKERIREFIMQDNLMLISNIVERVSKEFGIEKGKVFQLVEKVYEDLEREGGNG